MAAGEKAYFSYKSINSYIVRLCCEDDEYRTSGFLQVKIKKPEKFETIELPGKILLSSDVCNIDVCNTDVCNTDVCNTDVCNTDVRNTDVCN